MTIKKTREEQLVIQYLNKLGLKPYKNNRQFWDDLKRRHNQDIVNQLSEKMKVNDTDLDSLSAFYELKNSSLSLSIDVSKISADLYKKYFDWFTTQKGQAPKRILEVGCDNGIVACFLATLYPDSEVIGIDHRLNTIERAKELAEKLNLSNVSFIQMEIGEVATRFDKQSFDLIVSLSVFHELLNLQTPRYWSIGELLEMNETIDDTSSFISLKTLLKNNPSSKWISCERLPFMGAISVWAKAITASGFHILWDEMQYLHFQELGEQQKMPIFIASTQNNIDLLEKVYAFESKDKVLQLFDGKTLKEPEAEIVFEQTEDKEFVKGVEIHFTNGSGNMRIECWKTREKIFLYQFTNIGYRELKVFGNIEKALSDFENLKEQWTPYGKTYHYESIEEREQIET